MKITKTYYQCSGCFVEVEEDGGCAPRTWIQIVSDGKPIHDLCLECYRVASGAIWNKERVDASLAKQYPKAVTP